jgi:polysaccharide pyruvyl transferase WcaK-like protein
MRSNASVNYLLQQGNDASYIPDLAYLLKTETLSNKRNKLAMLTFRAPKNMDAFMLWYDKLVSSLTSNGYNILLYYQVKADYDFLKLLYDRQRNKNISFKENLLWYDEFSLYHNAELIISNRLHGLLVGAAHGVLPLAVLTQGSDVAKIKDVFDSSFMNQQNYFTTELDNCDKLIYMLQNTDSLHKLLNDIEFNNKIKCQSVFSEIAETFA